MVPTLFIVSKAGNLKLIQKHKAFEIYDVSSQLILAKDSDKSSQFKVYQLFSAFEFISQPPNTFCLNFPVHVKDDHTITPFLHSQPSDSDISSI